MAGLLLVTASPAIAEALGASLRERGFEVWHAESGEIAVKMASARVPDAILMDPSLSPMDRWHAVKRLYADPQTARVPVLTLTSDVETAGGAQRVLQKIERTLGPVPPPRVTPAAPASASAPAPRPAQVLVPPPTPRPSTPADPIARADAPPASSEDRTRRHRILVVDDSAMNRDTLSRRLERKGYEVHAVPSGEEALLSLARRGFDLVVLDWMMPGMSGLEALRRIRETWPPIQLPVIMATAKAETDDVVEALRAEANDYVTKPLNFDVVHARMRAHLALADSHRELLASEQRYRALLENTGDLIVQIELTSTSRSPDFLVPGGVLYVSPASRTLLGYEPDALKQRPFLEWLHPADRRALEEQYRRQGGWPPAFTFLARMERQDRQWIWVETSARVLRDGGHTLLHAACRDVTEHVERALGDEPPLPLGGDIMPHPGWRPGDPPRRTVPAVERMAASRGDPAVNATEPIGNGALANSPVVLTLMVGEFESVSHEELAARVVDELRRALGAKR